MPGATSSTRHPSPPWAASLDAAFAKALDPDDSDPDNPDRDDARRWLTQTAIQRRRYWHHTGVDPTLTPRGRRKLLRAAVALSTIGLLTLFSVVL